MKTKVFVYGTLRMGHPNHRVMQRAGGGFLGFESIKGYKKIEPPYLGYPFVIKTDNPEDTVEGEVYEVTDVEPLDTLEGYPTLYGKEEYSPGHFIYVAGPRLLREFKELV